MTPSMPQPPFDLPPATYDETAPRMMPVRGVLYTETNRFVRANVWACRQSRIKSGMVKPGDLAFELRFFK